MKSVNSIVLVLELILLPLAVYALVQGRHVEGMIDVSIAIFIAVLGIKHMKEKQA